MAVTQKFDYSQYLKRLIAETKKLSYLELKPTFSKEFIELRRSKRLSRLYVNLLKVEQKQAFYQSETLPN